MSVVEYLVVGAAVTAALAYLGRRLGRKFRSRGCAGGCCPVSAPKMRLAGRGERASTLSL